MALLVFIELVLSVDLWVDLLVDLSVDLAVDLLVSLSVNSLVNLSFESLIGLLTVLLTVLEVDSAADILIDFGRPRFGFLGVIGCCSGSTSWGCCICSVVSMLTKKLLLMLLLQKLSRNCLNLC